MADIYCTYASWIPFIHVPSFCSIELGFFKVRKCILITISSKVKIYCWMMFDLKFKLRKNRLYLSKWDIMEKNAWCGKNLFFILHKFYTTKNSKSICKNHETVAVFCGAKLCRVLILIWTSLILNLTRLFFLNTLYLYCPAHAPHRSFATAVSAV